jgi:hypothetical protein
MSPRAAELHQQKLLALMRAGRFLDGVHEDTNKRGCGEK